MGGARLSEEGRTMDLQDWNDRIFTEVVGKGDPDAPFYLYVDRAVLGRASGLLDDEAFEAFCTGYRQSFGHRPPFQEACQQAIRWSTRVNPAPPPMTAALAMTVLAVTEKPLGAPHALYARQNELLGLEPIPQAPPGYPDDVPQMWLLWNKWLLGPGSWVGRPTARTIGRLTNQGWARSQGLVKYADRQLIKEWFIACGLHRREEIDAQRLAADLVPWLLYRGKRGDHLRAVLGDSETQELLTEIVRQELAGWKGALENHGTGRTLQGRVALDTFQNRMYVAADLTAEQALSCTGEDCLPNAEAGMNVLGVPDAGWLLNDGCTLQLRPGLSVRAGGRLAYLLADDPSASAEVQVQAVHPHVSYTAVVRDDMLDRATSLLRRAGVNNLRAVLGPVPGWTRLTQVVLTGPLDDEQGLFGLGDRMPRRAPELELAGGLQVGPGSYLCDQPPDVLVPVGEDVRILQVDDTPYELGPTATVFPLGPLALNPGRHLVRLGEQSIPLTLTSYVNEVAKGGSAGFPLVTFGPRKVIGAFSTDPRQLGHALSGALLRDGSTVGRPVVTWVGDQAVLHLLTDEGRIYPITRTAPRWLRRVSLPCDYVDAQEVAAGVPGSPAFLLVRQVPGGRLRTVEIPRGGSEAGPGPGVRCPAEPLEANRLITDLISTAPETDRRLRAALSRALRNRPGQSRPALTRRAARVQAPVIPAEEEWEESRLDSPYDDLLSWLSEQEGGSASWKRLRETWSWLTRNGSPDDDRGWLVQYQLEILGHAESDHVHQRSIVAPAAAVRLSRAGGYAVLCGARPPEMVRRLMNPGDDQDPAVRDGGEHWFVNAKAQRDPDGRHVGPAALYLEWSSDHDADVERGLQALGVEVTWRTGDRLLDRLPTLEESVRNAPRRTMRPSIVFDRWCLRKDGARDWVSFDDDNGPGLYRYQVFGAPVHAWRPTKGEPLRVVDHREGKYLQLKRDAVQRILYHVPIGSWLIVPRSSPLPPLVARSLVLRTGQVPLALHLPAGREWRFPRNQALAYANVDSAMADRVERYLGLDLSHIMDPPEELL
jgi:hypothetical protein